MWPWSRPEQPEDVRKQLREDRERIESLERRMGSLVQDVEEFYAKVNKARQRVNKEDRDASSRVPSVGGSDPVGVEAVQMSKAELRRRLFRR